MFAALMVARMREAVAAFDKQNTTNESGKEALGDKRSWLSADNVDALDLPLARAAEKVLASMHEVLERTCQSMTVEMAGKQEDKSLDDKTLHLLRSRAAELKLVRHLSCLRDPTIEYRAERI